MIVNYYELSANFELPPEEAIQYFTSKGLAVTWNWHEMLNEQHDLAFTIAKMLDIDLLATVRDELDKAIANGKTLAEFQRELIPILQRRGWWGKKDIIDPATGHVYKIKLGSASRLETIFRTNIQSSYAAGHWESIQNNKDAMPYLMYDAVDDSRTRAEHAQFDGVVLPVDHNFWKTNYPPNGWNCRCGVIQMDANDLMDYGLMVNNNNFDDTKKWTNPNTGEIEKVPLGTDPGFAHNSGISLIDRLRETQRKKIDKLPPDAQHAAEKGVKAAQEQAEKAKRTRPKPPKQ
jgi:SPP1 gp7 family putative phage head morphogenesis protein